MEGAKGKEKNGFSTKTTVHKRWNGAKMCNVMKRQKQLKNRKKTRKNEKIKVLSTCSGHFGVESGFLVCYSNIACKNKCI
jgi:hypothetical protein